jgi:hypothetical protein
LVKILKPVRHITNLFTAKLKIKTKTYFIAHQPEENTMIKNTALIFLLLFLFSDFSWAQSNTALIWRGFSHSWTYNHRINRLGSYVSSQQNPAVYHTAASGLGADSCFFTAHYSKIESNSVFFQEGVESIKMIGKENQLISKTFELAIPAEKNMQGQDHYVTLLNGFDLQAIDNADKIQFFRIAVEDAYYAPALKELRFRINVGIVFNCQSLECSRFNQKSTYDLKLFYLIVAGDHDNLMSMEKTVTENYPWDRKVESNREQKQMHFNGHKENIFNASALGLKSISVVLDKAHWMLTYKNSVTPLDYNPKSGKATFNTDLFFQEWQQGMKKMSAMPKHSKFSMKRKGWCVLDTEVVLLQFKEADVTHDKFSGSFFWKGKNASPDVPEAVKMKKIN